MELIFTAFEVIFPVFALILLGFLIGKTQLLNDGFFAGANKLCFKVSLPILILYNLYTTKASIAEYSGVLTFAVVGVIGAIVLLLIFIPIFVKDNAKRGVMIQGSFRSNYVIFAIPLAGNLFGAENLGASVVLTAVIVPIFNISSVIILSFFNRESKLEPAKLIKDIVTNPLIIAAVLGLLISGFNITLPNFIENPLSSLASMASPLALIVLGATFRLEHAKQNMHYILSVSAIKLIILPLIAVIAAVLMGFRGPELGALLVLFASPIAVSSFIMAEQSGCDGSLAGELVVFTTAFSCISIFMFIYSLKFLGLF